MIITSDWHCLSGAFSSFTFISHDFFFVLNSKMIHIAHLNFGFKFENWSLVIATPEFMNPANVNNYMTRHNYSSFRILINIFNIFFGSENNHFAFFFFSNQSDLPPRFFLYLSFSFGMQLYS